MRQRLRGRRAELRERLRYLWRDEDNAGVVLLSAALSLGFALVLLWPDTAHPAAPRPPWLWGLLVGAAGTLKIVGVIGEYRRTLIVGLIVNAGFWATFAMVYGVRGTDPNWVLYATLCLAQMWSLHRAVRP